MGGVSNPDSAVISLVRAFRIPDSLPDNPINDLLQTIPNPVNPASDNYRQPQASMGERYIKTMTNEIYLSVAQAADLLGISQETLYKEIQSKNLTAIESPDRKRKHQVIAHSELSRLYGNIYIPDGYLEYSGDKSVDFVRIALRQENQRLRKAIGRDPDPRANLNDQLKTALENHKTLIQTHADLTKTIDNLTAVLDKMT